MKLWIISVIIVVLIITIVEIRNYIKRKKNMASGNGLGNQGPVIPGDVAQQLETPVEINPEVINEPINGSAPESTSTDEALAAAGVQIQEQLETNPVVGTAPVIALSPEKESLLQRVENWTDEEWSKLKDFLEGKADVVEKTTTTDVINPLESAYNTLAAHKDDITTKVNSAIPGFVDKLELIITSDTASLEQKIQDVTSNIATIKSRFTEAVALFEHLI